MRITLKEDARPVKKRPYRLNHRYKEKVKDEIDKMLAAGIIEPVEESEWVSVGAHTLTVLKMGNSMVFVSL